MKQRLQAPPKLVAPWMLAAIVMLALWLVGKIGCGSAAWSAPSTTSQKVVLLHMAQTQPSTPSKPQSILLQGVLNYTGAVQDVYAPRGYSLCLASEADATCWLRLHKPVDCKALFEEYLETLNTYVPSWPRPRDIPEELKDEFLLHGYTQLFPWYITQGTHAPDAKPPVWREATFQALLAKAQARVDLSPYTGATYAIYKALDCHSVAGQSGAVFGSLTPWVEAIMFANGARQMTTIEYRPTITEIPNHAMVTPADWSRGVLNGSMANVDFAFVFSSWEHDGLGRYGDPVDPWGDIKAVQKASCYVKPGGLLFLGVPSSTVDQLYFNAHRIYGPVRYPLLTANWAVVGAYDYQNATYADDGQCGQETCAGMFTRWQPKVAVLGSVFQPVVVLRNSRTTPCQMEDAAY